MTGRQLRMAITEPAKKAGSRIDDDLTDLLLDEVRTGQSGTFGAGVLPLLSHALEQAWRSRTGQEVTLADYERNGGIEGAVAASAQRAYDQLTPTQQDAARQIFLRLTATNSDGVDSADRATRAELTAGKSPGQALDVEAVLEAFAAERLLTLAAGSVELSHEAVLTAWPLLRDTWLGDTHADRIVRSRLHTTAAEWDRQCRDRSYLYGGSLLQAATDAVTRMATDPAHHAPLSRTERDFLDASSHARRRRARGRQAVVAGLVALTVTALIAAAIAVRSAANARHLRAIALSRQLAAESLNIDRTSPVTARQLAVAAWAVYPTGQAASAITRLLAEQQQQGMMPAAAALQSGYGTTTGGVFGVAFSPDGKLLASASGDGTVRVWNPATDQPIGAPIQASRRPGLLRVAFSPDGNLLASADGDGTVRLWNPATGRPASAPLQTSSGSSVGLNAVAFSADGKLLASSYVDGTVQLWNPATGRPVGAPLRTGSGRSGGVFEVAFSPDGKLLAGADSDGTVRMWNPATGKPAGPPIQATSTLNGVPGVAFSPDGKLLASADGDGTVRLWNPATRQPAGALLHASTQDGASAVTFSPDGKLLATAGGDGTVRL
jgi:hypothetical protein